MKTSMITVPKYKLKKGCVLVLRTCDVNLKSYCGFQWPAKGPVCAFDFREDYYCGGGLHGFLWGEGNGVLASFATDAKWLVVEVPEKDVLHGGGDLIGKCKFPAGNVIYSGSREVATALIQTHRPQAVVVGGTATAGDSGTATAGDSGTATAGYSGTATAGDRGTATAGYSGTATAGYRGTATAGYSGTATAGYSGIIQVRYYDFVKDRFRIATGYVGEDGIKANTLYRVQDRKLVEAK